MPSRNLNGGIGGGALVRCDADEEVAACDALPPVLRELIKGSFVNTKATTVLAQWRSLEAQGVPLKAYADWYAQRLAINTAKSCLVTYGPDHPDAVDPRARVERAFSEPKSDVLPIGRPGADAERAARRAAEIRLDDV